MNTLTAPVRAAAVMLIAAQALLFAASPALAQDDADDPPARAARLSAISGDVGFRAAQDADWTDASVNRPLTNGDALDLAAGARAELDLGGGQVRLGGQTRALVDRLDEQVARIHLEQGTVNLRVDQVERDPAFEIETPRASFLPSRPGEYRIDVQADGRTTLAVYDGAGTIYGEDGTRYEVRENQAYEFSDARLRDITGRPLPEPDDFDRWVTSRDARDDDGPAHRYVADSVVGVDDLDDYGRWETGSDYGAVWYPTVLVSDWAPYRYGHWVFVRPWGWTWVDDAPWGYAPFHYGRWVHRHGRWGWVPGPRGVRPVYAPALVGFIGGPSLSIGISSGPPLGWFPLGPREVYCPPYRVTRNYFTQVNVTNVTINHTVVEQAYQDVHVHRHGLDRQRYAYRSDAAATTVASREDFSRGRHIGNARMRVDADRLSRASLSTRLDVPRQADSSARRSDGHDRDRGWRDRASRDVDAPGHAAPSRTEEDRQPRPSARSDRFGSFDRGAAASSGSTSDHRDDGRLGAIVVPAPSRPSHRSDQDRDEARGGDRAEDRRDSRDVTRQVWRTPDRGRSAPDASRVPDSPQYGRLQTAPTPREQPSFEIPREPDDSRLRGRSPAVTDRVREPASSRESPDMPRSFDRTPRRENFSSPGVRPLPPPSSRSESPQRFGRPAQESRAVPQAPRGNPPPTAPGDPAQGRFGRFGGARNE